MVYNAAAGQFFAAIQWHGIYSSSDGATWNRLNNQPGGLSPVSCPATPSTPSCLLYRGEFAVVPGRNEMYFWYVDGNNIDRLIWQTKDGGGTWTQLDDDGITNCGDALRRLRNRTGNLQSGTGRGARMERSPTCMPGR